MFSGSFLGAQRVPKGSPKGFKIDEKEVSKRYLKTDPKKASKMMIFWTPQCGASVVNNSKINDFHVLVLAPFWGRFGSPNGGQKHETVVPKSHSKTGLKNDRFLIDFGVPFGVQNGAQNGLKTDIGSSRGSRGSQGSILEGCWINFGAILG